MKLNQRAEFSVKMLVLIILVSFLVYDLLLQIYYPKENLRSLRVLDRLDIYYAFFTTQSNYMVVLFLMFTLLQKKIYKSRPPFGIEVAITTYITVTMIVFWVGLVGSSNEAATYEVPHWVSTIVLHLFIPIVMIGNFIISSGDDYHSYKEHAKLSTLLICVYPILYLAFVLIRGEYRFDTYGPDFFKQMWSVDTNNVWSIQETVNNVPVWVGGSGFENGHPWTDQMFYPYWFLDMFQYNLTDANGTIFFAHDKELYTYILTFALAVFGIIILMVGLPFLYIYHNNTKYWRWHDIDGEMLTKAEHDQKMKAIKYYSKLVRQNKKLDKFKQKSEYNNFIIGLKDKKITDSQRKTMIADFKKNKVVERKELSKKRKQNKIDLRQESKKMKTYIRSLPVYERHDVMQEYRQSKRIAREIRHNQNVPYKKQT